MKLKEELEKRGLLYQYSHEALFDLYDQGGQVFYCGYDPSADSLTIGNFVTFMAAVNLMKRGNKRILLIGGATGMIGDPGGKDSERNFLDEKTLQYNQEAITKQVSQILENLTKISGYKFEIEVVNNFDFYKEMNVLEFYRKVGKYITVNNMITKETVRKRIEDPDKSISYTEFSYMLLQGYDFVKLYQDKEVKLQLSGSDQWGNAVTGIELISKILDHESYVMTIPLITDSQGKKFGKSEDNAIWLDPNKNSPYFAYQYFINTADTDLERYLKIFTLYDFEYIANIMNEHNIQPEKRTGQKILAQYVITAVFGEKSALQAELISELLFGEKDKMEIIKNLRYEDIIVIQKEIGGHKIDNLPIKIIDLIVLSKLEDSKTQAKKLIENGGLFLNEQKISNINADCTNADFIDEKVVLLRKGKKNFKLVII